MLWPTLSTERLNPFTQMRQLQREMQNLFGGDIANSEAFPAVNIWSSEGSIVMTAELPGVDAKDINISVLGDQLTLEGERKDDEVKEDTVYYRRERGAGRFARVFKLPFDVNDEKVSAKLNNGILTVCLSKSESSKPKKINILSA